MDIAQILDELTNYKKLPAEAIRAAEADRPAAVPAFLEAIEHFLAASTAQREEPNPLFFIFHLLGSWREKSAYRPLARLLALPRDEVELAIEGAIPETVHRVMAAVFDGDPQPLYDVILNEHAEEFVRSRMLETVAMVTLRGDIAREEAARFLHVCFAKLQAEPGCFAWNGWQSAVAMLGLEEMTPLAKQAFDQKWVDPSWLSFKHFLDDLRLAVEQPGARRDCDPEYEYTLFGDSIDEFSTWYCFSPKYEEDKRRTAAAAAKAPRWDAVQAQAINPFKNVGRNDPCPCGSGRKFKKCCLNKQQVAPVGDQAA